MPTRILSALSISLALSGCALDEQVDDFEETEQSIKNGAAAAMWQWQRAAILFDGNGNPTCTATLISPTHLLTASHCKPNSTHFAQFYTSSNNLDGSTTRAILKAEFPDGVWPAFEDVHDDNGKFADIAVVTLASSAPATSVVADVAWNYLGADAWGIKVGGGEHDDTPMIGQLRIATDITYSATDTDGLFHTEECDTNPGDSGGPFYTNPRAAQRVVGVLWGEWLDGVVRNRYTSARQHLSWILGRIGYTFGGLEFSGFRRLGLQLQVFTGAKNVCEYACERTAGCVAFNWLQYFNSCQLLSATTGITAQAGYVTGEK